MVLPIDIVTSLSKRLHSATHAESPTTSVACSDTLEKFRRLLKIGVPRDQVRRGMIQEGLNPGDLLGTSSDVPSSTATMMSSRDSNSDKKVRRKMFATLFPRSRTLPLGTSTEPTIWTRTLDAVDSICISSDTADSFDRSFAKCELSASASISFRRRSSAVSSTPDANIGIIDRGRAQNIAILLRGVKLSNDEWRRLILDFSADQVPFGTMKMLLQLWPSSTELKSICEYSQDPDTRKLGLADQFFYDLRDIPRLQQKLSCLVIKHSLPERMQELDDGAPSLIAGTIGFNVQTLSRFQQVKAFDDSQVTFLKRDVADIARFPKEIDLFRRIAKISVASLLSERAALDDTLKELYTEIQEVGDEKLKQELDMTQQLMRHFADEAHAKMSGLLVVMEQLNVAVTELHRYWEEDQGTPTDDIFAHIINFVDAFERETSVVTQQHP
ncbi:hypothetical protein PINS_up019648 [Pythium insidiosum]|nr:hypothetical protein PINS_up019648 [Pythium insidiosum]